MPGERGISRGDGPMWIRIATWAGEGGLRQHDEDTRSARYFRYHMITSTPVADISRRLALGRATHASQQGRESRCFQQLR
jgi:hypothetical protein